MTDSARSTVMQLAAYAGADAQAPQRDVQSIPVLSLDQLREQSQNTKWLVKHVLPTESVGLLFGASGTFKSFIAIDMALHIAHGLPWLGRKTRQGPVLIVAAEGGTGLWPRIVAWHRERRLPWKDAPVYVVPVAVNLRDDAILVREAVAAAVDVVPLLVVVDTLSQTFVGEENSAQEVGEYLRELGIQFRQCWQCAVMVVHHSGHSATERPRGSSALRANVDFMFGVFRDEKEMLATLECLKQKDGELIDKTCFAMKVCELARDEDDEPITSLVARQVENSDEMLSLMQTEAARGRGGRAQLLMQLAQNGMKEKELRTVFYEHLQEVDGEARKKAFYRARTWAIEARLIEIAEGVVIVLDEPGKVQR